jgi:hypothetical protein
MQDTLLFELGYVVDNNTRGAVSPRPLSSNFRLSLRLK